MSTSQDLNTAIYPLISGISHTKVIWQCSVAIWTFIWMQLFHVSPDSFTHLYNRAHQTGNRQKKKKRDENISVYWSFKRSLESEARLFWCQAHCNFKYVGCSHLYLVLVLLVTSVKNPNPRAFLCLAADFHSAARGCLALMVNLRVWLSYWCLDIGSPSTWPPFIYFHI